MVRGGGSRTDLAPFDGEVIARAIALAAVPVVTGIGHEVDRSIADEVAHRRSRRRPRAPPGSCCSPRPPSSGPRRCGPPSPRPPRARLVSAEDRVRNGAHRLERSSAGGLAAGERSLLEAARRLGRESTRALTLADQRLAGAEARRRSFDPALALARGWSITRDDAGRVVRSVHETAPGTRLVTTIADGDVRSTVDDG